MNEIPLQVVGFFFDSFFLALPFNIRVIGFKQVSFHINIYKNERKSCHLLKRENYYFSLTARKTKLVFLLHDALHNITKSIKLP